MTKRTALVGLLLLAVTAAGCGADDGAGVRNLGGSSGSGSGSGSSSSSGSVASGSASALAAECSPVGQDLEASGEVAVTLDEWEVSPERASASAGVVNFTASAVGEDAHELVVVRADDAESIPLAEDGAVDEASLGTDLIGEIEPFPAGSDCDGAFELEKGNYVLLCAIIETHEGELENHFELGMHTEFTVE